MDELRDTQYNLPIGTDCISRRKLLDKFEPWLEVHDYNDGERNVIKAVLYEIKCMPPATDTNAGTKLGTNLAEVGTDCISRQAAIEAVQNRHMMLSKEKVLLINDLEKLPSAQPEIIRCKDCKHWDTTWQNDYAPNYHYCPMIDGTRRNDFYCAYAERREVTT